MNRPPNPTEAADDALAAASEFLVRSGVAISTFDRAREHPSLPIEPTEDAIAMAKDFVLQKWQERWIERNPDGPKFYAACGGWDKMPEDLSSACKFSSMFAVRVFGGELRGNEEHQFTELPDGSILDLNSEAADVAEMEVPYAHDHHFFGSPDHMASMESCLPRVENWVDEFVALLALKEENEISETADITMRP